MSRREYKVAVEKAWHFAQHVESIGAKWHDMRLSVFRSFGGNDPDFGIKIDFAPSHLSQFATALRGREEHGHELAKRVDIVSARSEQADHLVVV